MDKQKNNPDPGKGAGKTATGAGEKKPPKKLQVTDKLLEKLKKIRSKDPNIYPLW